MKSCGNPPVLQTGLAALVIAAGCSNIISITVEGLDDFTDKIPHSTNCRGIQNAHSGKLWLIKFNGSQERRIHLRENPHSLANQISTVPVPQGALWLFGEIVFLAESSKLSHAT